MSFTKPTDKPRVAFGWDYQPQSMDQPTSATHLESVPTPSQEKQIIRPSWALPSPPSHRQPYGGRVSVVQWLRTPSGTAYQTASGDRLFVTGSRSCQVPGRMELWQHQEKSKIPVKVVGANLLRGDITSITSTRVVAGQSTLVYAGTSKGSVMCSRLGGLTETEDGVTGTQYKLGSDVIHVHPAGRPAACTVLEVSPNGHQLLAGGEGGTLRLLSHQDFQVGREENDLAAPMQLESTAISDAKYLDNNTVLYTCNIPSLRLWDLRAPIKNGQAVSSAVGTARTQWETYSRVALQPLENSTFVATAGDSGLMHLWDLRSPKEAVMTHNVWGPFNLQEPVWALHLPNNFGRNRHFTAYAAVGHSVKKVDMTSPYRTHDSNAISANDPICSDLIKDALPINALDVDDDTL
eukprot:Ihof_evm5s57 gene=Ihof_evmTU5s57